MHDASVSLKPWLEPWITATFCIAFGFKVHPSLVVQHPIPTCCLEHISCIIWCKCLLCVCPWAISKWAGEVHRLVWALMTKRNRLWLWSRAVWPRYLTPGNKTCLIVWDVIVLTALFPACLWHDFLAREPTNEEGSELYHDRFFSICDDVIKGYTSVSFTWQEEVSCFFVATIWDQVGRR